MGDNPRQKYILFTLYVIQLLRDFVSQVYFIMSSGFSEEYLQSLTVTRLRSLLKKQKLGTNGRKQQLVRLGVIDRCCYSLH